MQPTAHQLKLAARLESAFQSGGALACTARSLYVSPQGRDYRRLDGLVQAGLAEKTFILVGNRVACAWVPLGAVVDPSESSALTDLL